MNIRFEPATPADAETLTDVQVRAFHDDARLYPGVELGGPPGYDSVEVTLKDIADYHCFKILLDEQIVGGILIFDWGDGHFHLDRLYIDPTDHNRGIGSRAMQFMEQTFAAKKWSLHTPLYATRNQHFYEKHGYVKTGEEIFDGLQMIAYEKQM